MAAVAKASNRVKVILNDEPALKLHRLAKRTRTEPDPRDVTALLDRIDGAWEGALAGLHEARSGLGIPLEDL